MSIYTYDPTEFMPIFNEDRELINKGEFIAYKLKRTARITNDNITGAIIEVGRAFKRARRAFQYEQKRGFNA